MYTRYRTALQVKSVWIGSQRAARGDHEWELAQSAAEIAVEVSAAAQQTLISVRSGVRVIPRRIGCGPYDAAEGRWIAAVLTARLCLPAPKQMWRAIERAERRTRHGAPASGSRRRAPAASAAIRTPIDGYCSPTCAEHDSGDGTQPMPRDMQALREGRCSGARAMRHGNAG